MSMKFLPMSSSHQTTFRDKRHSGQFPFIMSRTVKSWGLKIVSAVSKITVLMTEGLINIICLTRFLLQIGEWASVFLHPVRSCTFKT